MIQLRQEREEQYKKLQELQQIADNLNSDKTKYDIEIIKRMKKAFKTKLDWMDANLKNLK